MSSQTTKPRTVILIGDIHGYFTKLQSLWKNLQKQIPPENFNSALVIFLGDYCDRGPDTRSVLDFLVALPESYPNQSHVFLAGNHDFAFAAFLRVIPEDRAGGFEEGWKEYAMNEEREGWFKGDGFERMHLQGRRWGGKITVKFNVAKGLEYQGSIYDAGPTFSSYGVDHGSPGTFRFGDWIGRDRLRGSLGFYDRCQIEAASTNGLRLEPDLVKAVPETHKKFLADMVWVHEEDDVCIETKEGLICCKLIAVHAGLEKGKCVQEQIKSLKAKESHAPKIEALSGRKNVWNIPEELAEKQTIVVSGHHAKLSIEGLRLVIDQGGGYPDRPIAAVVLPSKTADVRDTDSP